MELSILKLKYPRATTLKSSPLDKVFQYVMSETKQRGKMNKSGKCTLMFQIEDTAKKLWP